MNNIAIVGGTGLIGSHLVKRLNNGKNQLHILTRGKSKKVSENIYLENYDYESNNWPVHILTKCETVINLAGKSLGDKRLTPDNKKEVSNSRVELTKSLVTFLNNSDNICNTLINGSAVGYYGYDRSDEPLDEDADPGMGFMAKLCIDWEREADKLEDRRLIKLRTGIVLDKEEGAFPKLKAPILLGVGSALASGKQFMPWIHINDMIAIIEYCITNENIKGVVNAVAPNPVRNKRMIGAIADSLNKAILLPKVPSFALKLILGEFANAIIGGLKVVPKKLTDNNFIWEFYDIDAAVKRINWNK